MILIIEPSLHLLSPQELIHVLAVIVSNLELSHSFSPHSRLFQEPLPQPAGTLAAAALLLGLPLKVQKLTFVALNFRHDRV